MTGSRPKGCQAPRRFGAKHRVIRLSRARQFVEPPTADPHGGWCGEGRLEAGPYPIGRLRDDLHCKFRLPAEGQGFEEYAFARLRPVAANRKAGYANRRVL